MRGFWRPANSREVLVEGPFQGSPLALEGGNPVRFFLPHTWHFLVQLQVFGGQGLTFCPGRANQLSTGTPSISQVHCFCAVSRKAEASLPVSQSKFPRGTGTLDGNNKLSLIKKLANLLAATNIGSSGAVVQSGSLKCGAAVDKRVVLCSRSNCQVSQVTMTHGIQSGHRSLPSYALMFIKHDQCIIAASYHHPLMQ